MTQNDPQDDRKKGQMNFNIRIQSLRMAVPALQDQGGRKTVKRLGTRKVRTVFPM